MGSFVRENLPDPISFFEGEGVKLDGKGKWRTTRCDFHGSRASMRVNTETGAWVCMAGCGARGGDVVGYFMAAHGADFRTAARALGAWADDGRPDVQHRPKPLPANQAVQVLAFESTLTATAAGSLARGVRLNDTDRARLFVAAQRIQTILGFFA